MKFRGHETFFIRKGWLYKGLKQVDINPQVFVDKENKPTDVLGIGTNMVKALRYWMQAVGLTDEKRDGNTRYQEFTDFAKLIWNYDKYMEEDGTLWFIHYLLSSNQELATTWYWFFNEFNIREFTKDDFILSIDGYVKYNLEGTPVAQSSLEDDFNCLLHTYISRKKMHPERVSPENTIDSPLGILGILDIVDEKKKIYKKVVLRKDMIHPLVILAVIVDQYQKKENKNSAKEIKIANLLSDKCNIGKTFVMDLNVLNYYLDRLQEMGYLKVVRTAGLDVIKLNTDMKPMDILTTYYEELNLVGLREENE
ncbi:hypothetical protein CACET_c21430 [Clostridium aceticum]|uniref:Uncharacterized protein n=1 Tax=Clostridium aceticum TaxID=84022 RepID=A0A0D8ICC1_9CLOT|nr:DUF4007 family protein [Clostridium aceticum]AKL95590.1 hypothetical protein CACET_c21430 [Clostridium aceticum]KJF26836.1 hypothetical protein TZ02_11535 [Clostridium aceticum]